MKIIKQDDFEEGSDFEEDVYTEKGRDELVENDEIDEIEAGFMEGFENTDLAFCDNCKRNLKETDEKNIIEEEINNKKRIFCCRSCRDEFDNKTRV